MKLGRTIFNQLPLKIVWNIVYLTLSEGRFSLAECLSPEEELLVPEKKRTPEKEINIHTWMIQENVIGFPYLSVSYF